MKPHRANLLAEYSGHAGMPRRSLRIERQDFRVRPVGADETGVELPQQVPIGCVLAGAGDKPQILPPRDMHAFHFKQMMVVFHGLPNRLRGPLRAVQPAKARRNPLAPE